MPTSYTETIWTSHDGLRLYARVYAGPEPSAKTVLCRHGLTRNSSDFEDLAPHLQNRYRVIVPDVRGIPALAIRGAQSDILSAVTFAKMKAENPELELLEVAQRGHAPLLDEPECVAAIDAFLARTQ